MFKTKIHRNLTPEGKLLNSLIFILPDDFNNVMTNPLVLTSF